MSSAGRAGTAVVVGGSRSGLMAALGLARLGQDADSA
ncbi:hypothetical protein CHMI_00773 [Cellulomonas hominis]|nr:hypothetical protein CHMI_00773 [Cellulomonas hominis]